VGGQTPTAATAATAEAGGHATTDGLPLKKRRRSSAPLILRVATEGLIAAVLVGLLVYNSNQQFGNELSAENVQIATLQAQVAGLQGVVQDLKERWYGSPAIYLPPRTINVAFKYFDVRGTTQLDLIQSLDNANICKVYGPCLKDPLNPSGIAWAAEWLAPATAYYYCSTPATTNVLYRQFILLPRWAPPADGSVKISLVEQWNALMQVFYTHEAGHAAIDRKDIAALNNQAHGLRTCAAVFAFWNSRTLWNKDTADQLAYHARLYADCRPEVGCIPDGWMGW
jgi:hypothetical protein